jgi:GMP synthase-like glutamine amidotransferase
MILILKHVSIEGPGLIGALLAEGGEKVKVVDLEKGERLPDSLKGVDGVVVLGGPMNVYEEDKYPFLCDEDKFIKKVILKEIPYLGICLGAQLLAKAAYAHIGKSPVKEIGWHKVNLTEKGRGDRLFDGLACGLEVFQWHEDTFGVPLGGILLAKGERCHNQAIKVGRCAYGLQFHLEVDGDMISDWVEEYIPSSTGAMRVKGKEMVNAYYAKEEELSKQAAGLCRNFKNIIDECRVRHLSRSK